jgi:predicted RNA-binding protein with PUA-like domain
MAYWLIKTEPSTWSWADQVAAGNKGTAWEGVRNFQAMRNLKAMKKGDRAFFYHTGDEKRIMGIAEVIGEYRKDPSDKAGTFGLVDVRAVEPLARPVTLAEIRADKRLKDMVLVKVSRLSVQPITAAEWKTVNDLAKRKVG